MSTIFESASSDYEKLTRAATGGSLLVTSTILSGVFWLLLMITLTRLLGPEKVGLFGPLLSLFWVVGALI